MSATWMSREQAATVIGVSIRQLQRQVKQGVVQSRMTSEGRRQVLVELPNDDDVEQVTSEGHDDTRSFSDDRALVLAGSHRQLAERLVDQTEAELRRARRIGAAGWSLTGALVIAGMVGIGWGTAHVTRSGVTIEALNADLAESRERVGDTERQLGDTRKQLAEAMMDVTEAQTRLKEQGNTTQRILSERDQLRVELEAARQALDAANVAMDGTEQLAAVD